MTYKAPPLCSRPGGQFTIDLRARASQVLPPWILGLEARQPASLPDEKVSAKLHGKVQLREQRPGLVSENILRLRGRLLRWTGLRMSVSPPSLGG